MAEGEPLTAKQLISAIRQIEDKKVDIQEEGIFALHMERKYLETLDLVKLGLEIAMGKDPLIYLDSTSYRRPFRLEIEEALEGVGN